jgi:hypothetical protein
VDRSQSHQSEKGVQGFDLQRSNGPKTLGQMVNLTNAEIMENRMDTSVEDRKARTSIGDQYHSAMIRTESMLPGVFEPNKKLIIMTSQIDFQELESVLNQTLQHQR